MKLGGSFCTCAGLGSFFLPFYTLNQILIGGFYIYCICVKYKDGADDEDDKFTKLKNDEEAIKGKAMAVGAKAMQKVTPKSFGNVWMWLKFVGIDMGKSGQSLDPQKH